jgi:DNA-directed RNA polymerase specialized sigma subunit
MNGWYKARQESVLEENTAHKKKQEVYQDPRTDSKDEGIMKWESAQWFRIMESVEVIAEREQAVHLEIGSRVAAGQRCDKSDGLG